MSVLRQLNILGQMRLDVPHLRSIESSIAADFDVVAGRVQAGETALVVRGFSLANFGTGTAANSVQLNTADGIVYNMNATEAGTFLWVPADRDVETLNSATNPRVSGSFTASQVNYVGVDFTRNADPATTDLVQFLDPNTLLENAKSVPLGRVLDYRIVISGTPFGASPNVTPIAKITTDPSNNVLSVQDARNIMWRLGTGGDFPNPLSTYAWPQNRTEASSGTGLFAGGDKGIDSQKGWMDAVMTRLWELGGGENWYSPTADRNVRMIRKPAPDVFSNGDNFEWDGSNLHWKALLVVFDNSNTVGAYYNTVSDQTGNVVGLTDLANGECIYVDINRASNATVTAQKAVLQTLSVPTTPGSRLVLAWRAAGSIYTRDSHLPVGTLFTPATITANGAVRLSRDYSGQPSGYPSPLGSASSPVAISDRGGYILAVTGSNHTALFALGDGSGHGLWAYGGATGDGIRANAGSTSGNALVAVANNATGAAVSATATGSGAGVSASSSSGPGGQFASSTGPGVRVLGGGLDIPSGGGDISIGTLAQKIKWGSNVYIQSDNSYLSISTGATERWRILSTGELQAQGGNRAIQNVLDPVNPQDAVTLNHLESLAELTPTLAANWTGDGVVYAVPKYWRTSSGMVGLMGAAEHSSDGNAVTMFTLPVGYRPSYNMTFIVQLADTSICKVSVETNGNVTPRTLTGLGAAVGTSFVHLDGITFPMFTI